MKQLVIICLIAVLFPLTAQTVKAVSTPPQFSCSAPIGQTIASYSEGTHGIPGDSATYTGSDTVYRVDSDHVLQCFCPDNGNGIQSNWWKVSEVSEDDINYYQKLGWVYIPNGALWGLDDSSYFVKNTSYSCSSDGGTGGTGGNNGGSGSGSSSSSNSNSSSNNDNGVGGAIGSILGASALAATGSARSIVLFTLVGVIFAWAAYRLRRE